MKNHKQLPPEDMVNTPSHYATSKDDPYEHYKVMIAWGLTNHAFLYNVTKYICRFGKKGRKVTHLQDLKKARWYLNKAIEEVEKR